MNKIEKFRTELEKYEEKYALLIKEHIQEEINKIDSDIEISIYSNDIDRICFSIFNDIVFAMVLLWEIYYSKTILFLFETIGIYSFLCFLKSKKISRLLIFFHF